MARVRGGGVAFEGTAHNARRPVAKARPKGIAIDTSNQPLTAVATAATHRDDRCEEPQRAVDDMSQLVRHDGVAFQRRQSRQNSIRHHQLRCLQCAGEGQRLL